MVLDPSIRQFVSCITEDIAVYRWEGESVTLKCSSEGRPSNAEEYNGLYLYRQDCKGEEEEEVLHHHGRNGRISPQQRFSGRVLTTGSLMNHTITISSLTIEDAGLYRCVYVNKNYDRVKCNGYRLVVRGVLERSPVHSNSPFPNGTLSCSLMVHFDNPSGFHW